MNAVTETQSPTEPDEVVATAAEGGEPLLRLRGVSKTFPGVRALNSVDLDVQAGEVHALLGENGAGKSTLMKILAGIYQPDEGDVMLQGQVVRMHNPMDAKRNGVLLIHQELSLVPDMTVAENVFLGRFPARGGIFLNSRRLTEDCAAILEKLKCQFRPSDYVKNLSIANQQMVEIARALVFVPKVVVFDEPTASLTDYEKVVLFDVIRDLRSRGAGIVYISHRMEEIFELSERITVLRDGEHRGTFVTSETSEDEVTQRMIGRNLEGGIERTAPEMGKVAVSVRGLTLKGCYEDISFDVRSGEVVGLYGLIGAGRTEIVETLFGLHRPDAGEIVLNGESVTLASPVDAIDKGLALVPENRKEQGLVLEMNCRDNMTLPHVDRYTSFGWLDHRAENETFETYMKQLKIKTPGWQQKTLNLSGGNQQKVVIGKWLSTRPSVLILDEPTRGIDVGSKAEIHRLIRELAKLGLAVIVVSSEMPEILTVSDRILALYHGALVEDFERDHVTEDTLIKAITGQL